jgi:hypothetical protein
VASVNPNWAAIALLPCPAALSLATCSCRRLSESLHVATRSSTYRTKASSCCLPLQWSMTLTPGTTDLCRQSEHLTIPLSSRSNSPCSRTFSSASTSAHHATLTFHFHAHRQATCHQPVLADSPVLLCLLSCAHSRFLARRGTVVLALALHGYPPCFAATTLHGAYLSRRHYAQTATCHVGYHTHYAQTATCHVSYHTCLYHKSRRISTSF